MNKARCGGIDLAFEDVGSGAPVLFIHGFPHDHTLWAAQIGALRDRCRCIVPDLRGFGGSGAAGPYSMDRYADDLAELLDHLGLSESVVAGLSMGGYIAFALWRRRADRIRALVLADTRAGADTEEGRGKRRELIVTARERGMGAVAEAQITGMLGKSTRELQPSIVEEVRAMIERAPVEGTVGALEAMIARPDSVPTLATINVPTLILVGEEDVLTPVKESRAMHDRIAGSRLQTIAGAGHLSNLEGPSAFNQALAELIDSIGFP